MSFKILSLDGGGSWAMIQAWILADLYGDDISGRDLLRNFDLVIANSGGSVFLGMLLTDKKLKDIVAFYSNATEVAALFPRLKWYEKFWLKILRLKKMGPQFSSSRKAKQLKALLIKSEQAPDGQTAIADCPLHEIPARIGQPELRIIITSFDYFNQRATFFRSAKDQPNQFGHYTEIKLANAIHASCNAPVNYYEEPAHVHLKLNNPDEKRQAWYWDGAIGGFNNPVLAGLVEAITNFSELSLKEIKVLSIGTGCKQKIILVGDDTSNNSDTKRRYVVNKTNPLVETKKDFGFIKDIMNVSTSIMSDPPDAASFIAASFMNPTLSNQQLQLIRINPCITPRLVGDKYVAPEAYQDKPEHFEKLFDIDMSAHEQYELDMIAGLCKRFIETDANKPAVANQLIRGSIRDGKYLGHPYYRDAKAAWYS